jgi:hypothetical protein
MDQLVMLLSKKYLQGIWDDVAVERSYRGDILQNIRKWEPTEHKNDDVVISNRISIIADIFAYENLSTIRYVSWMGIRWKVNNIENPTTPSNF